jgi:hypothetical protein
VEIILSHYDVVLEENWNSYKRDFGISAGELLKQIPAI